MIMMCIVLQPNKRTIEYEAEKRIHTTTASMPYRWIAPSAFVINILLSVSNLKDIPIKRRWETHKRYDHDRGHSGMLLHDMYECECHAIQHANGAHTRRIIGNNLGVCGNVNDNGPPLD
jgi:hypothetical protein